MWNRSLRSARPAGAIFGGASVLELKIRYVSASDGQGAQGQSQGLKGWFAGIFRRRQLQPLTAPPGGLSVATWNVAAVNNNPFEYWITHNDRRYEELMIDFENMVVKPGERDVEVAEVFSDGLYKQLRDCMEREGWDGLEVVDQIWRDDLKKRKIISGFLKDKTLGAKRLTSMPDRITNTINVANSDMPVCRPTVVNNYRGSLTSISEWWSQWQKFMFEGSLQVQVKQSIKEVRPCQMLSKISRKKYPAITEEEERVSLPLQTLCQAIFDAILVHLMLTLSPDGSWLTIKQSVVDSMFSKKAATTINILQGACADIDVLCLQECAASLETSLAKSSMGKKYHILLPSNTDASRNQNSIILLRKATFPSAPSECTEEALAKLSSGAQVEKGDLVVVSARDAFGKEFLVASFHGDTNGLATKPVVSAVHEAVRQRGNSCNLVFGLDANVYLQHSASYQGVDDFLGHCDALGLRSCWPDGKPMDECLTTCHARTFVQAQLSKGIRRGELFEKGDLSPKDHILFKRADYSVEQCYKDNTGSRTYIEKSPFPSLAFPSDHALVSVVLTPNHCAKL